jgi:hypothetical protein
LESAASAPAGPAATIRPNEATKKTSVVSIGAIVIAGTASQNDLEKEDKEYCIL